MAGRPRTYGEDYRADVRVLVRRGLSRSEIARRLGMSERTVYRLLGRHEVDG